MVGECVRTEKFARANVITRQDRIKSCALSALLWADDEYHVFRTQVTVKKWTDVGGWLLGEQTDMCDRHESVAPFSSLHLAMKPEAKVA